MQPLLLLAFCTFLFALIYTPLCRDLFRKLGVFDHPDADRKIHNQPIPRVGGIAMALALGSTYLVTLLLRGWLKPIPGLDLAWRVLPGACIVFLTGLLDDWITLRPWQKFLGQLLGSGWAYFAGLQVSGMAGFHAQHWLSLPLTLFWLVLCTNAFNLIDGVDGLATGVGLFATLTMVLAAFLQNNLALAAVTLPLAGFLLGFLRYNFNPANVFLGDSGSLLIGFLLGCYGVIWSDKSATLLGMTAPLMALFVPLLDVGLSVVRRFLRHQPIFDADRGHIHHRLLDRGLTPRLHVGRAVFDRPDFRGTTIRGADRPGVLRNHLDRDSASGLRRVQCRQPHAPDGLVSTHAGRAVKIAALRGSTQRGRNRG